MDLPTPAIIDPLHLFTKTQKVNIAQQIDKQAQKTHCHIQVVVGNDILNVQNVATENVPDDVSERIVIDDITKEIGYDLNWSSCVNKKLIQDYTEEKYLFLDSEVAKELNSKINKVEKLYNIALESIAISPNTLNAIAEKQQQRYQKEKEEEIKKDTAVERKIQGENNLNASIGAGFVFFAIIFIFFFILLTIYKDKKAEQNNEKQKIDRVTGPRRALTMTKDDFFLYLFPLSFQDIIKRNKKYTATKLSKLFASIRSNMLAKNRVESWCELFEETIATIDEINKRYAIYLKHSENAEPHDKELAMGSLVKDACTLVEELISLDITLKPRMTKEIVAEITQTNKINKTLPIAIEERIRTIEEHAEQMEKSLPQEMYKEAYIVRELRSRYIPDTISAYYNGKTKNSDTAIQMLSEQLTTIEDGITKTSEAIQEKNVDKLRANGHFLKEIFK